MNFEVIKRNTGHWDILSNARGRLFRVRGAPSRVVVYDERRNILKDPIVFKTVSTAMAYICDELMFELVATEHQEVTRIEDWNL